jgi:hypothetical protein
MGGVEYLRVQPAVGLPGFRRHIGVVLVEREQADGIEHRDDLDVSDAH